MKLSNLISALQHIQKERGDLTVLEDRLVFYDAWEPQADKIEVDSRVCEVIRLHDPKASKHRYERAEFFNGRVTHKDAQRLVAFIL